MVNNMKRSEIKRRQFSEMCQSYFDKYYACWANNHNGWRKMKRKNRRIFKKKLRRETAKEIDEILMENDYDGGNENDI